ncbi:hypothetical protein E1B28_005848 [Marasmius oreades]|uniref:Uncharacterized protein n=1 Tax=Marasmius oreades TaxID=181124 RepID=A0A9P7UV00_9AGAR|nr:uncharacterized protein E1B28_005848 [Marasmius oreades]KAG7095058.1 hypothetical protein E1B28_005848 [Marasmius oreades]
MKLFAALNLFLGVSRVILDGLRFAFVPTLVDVLRNPLRIFRLSETYMTHLWAVLSDLVDENARPMKESIISSHAHGVVLDLGAGYGHTILYLGRPKVSRYIALEPNVCMHAKIRGVANKSGFFESDGSLVILDHRAENLSLIPHFIDGPVDTLITVLTVCSIPNARRVLTRLVRDIVKPGGQFLFYEHVRNPRDDVAWWQKFYNPVWGLFFDGCRLDQPTDKWVEDMKDLDEYGKEICMWSEGNCWTDPNASEENLTWHVAGRFVKRFS